MTAAPPGARAVTVAAERLERWLAGFAERHGATVDDAEPDVVALVGADGARAWIEVPFPPLTGDLIEHVDRDRRVGVLLVRRGGHAAGVFDGAALVASKVGSSYVQGTTKAGGWSQQRYARRRANQADAAFAHAADAAVRVLGGGACSTRSSPAATATAVQAVLADRAPGPPRTAPGRGCRSRTRSCGCWPRRPSSSGPCGSASTRERTGPRPAPP